MLLAGRKNSEFAPCYFFHANYYIVIVNLLIQEDALACAITPGSSRFIA